MVGQLVMVGECGPKGRGPNPHGSILMDFPLPFKNSNSCNPTSTIHNTKKVYLNIRMVEGSQACRACRVGIGLKIMCVGPGHVLD